MEGLAAKEYLRQRLEPRPGDSHYLCLSDLLIAIRSLSLWVQRGCWTMAVVALRIGHFSKIVYHRADLIGGTNLDFDYGADGRLPSELKDYDCVLSTQVLEHVEDPASLPKGML